MVRTSEAILPQWAGQAALPIDRQNSPVTVKLGEWLSFANDLLHHPQEIAAHHFFHVCIAVTLLA
jgi:hypothetical protein